MQGLGNHELYFAGACIGSVFNCNHEGLFAPGSSHAGIPWQAMHSHAVGCPPRTVLFEEGFFVELNSDITFLFVSRAQQGIVPPDHYRGCS